MELSFRATGDVCAKVRVRSTNTWRGSPRSTTTWRVFSNRKSVTGFWGTSSAHFSRSSSQTRTQPRALFLCWNSWVLLDASTSVWLFWVLRKLRLEDSCSRNLEKCWVNTVKVLGMQKNWKHWERDTNWRHLDATWIFSLSVETLVFSSLSFLLKGLFSACKINKSINEQMDKTFGFSLFWWSLKTNASCAAKCKTNQTTSSFKFLSSHPLSWRVFLRQIETTRYRSRPLKATAVYFFHNNVQKCWDKNFGHLMHLTLARFIMTCRCSLGKMLNFCKQATLNFPSNLQFRSARRDLCIFFLILEFCIAATQTVARTTSMMWSLKCNFKQNYTHWEAVVQIFGESRTPTGVKTRTWPERRTSWALWRTVELWKLLFMGLGVIQIVLWRCTVCSKFFVFGPQIYIFRIARFENAFFCVTPALNHEISYENVLGPPRNISCDIPTRYFSCREVGVVFTPGVNTRHQLPTGPARAKIKATRKFSHLSRQKQSTGRPAESSQGKLCFSNWNKTRTSSPTRQHKQQYSRYPQKRLSTKQPSRLVRHEEKTFFVGTPRKRNEQTISGTRLNPSWITCFCIKKLKLNPNLIAKIDIHSVIKIGSLNI